MAEVKLRHRKNVETRSSEDRSVNQADSQAPQKLPCLKNNHDNEDTEEILKGFVLGSKKYYITVQWLEISSCRCFFFASVSLIPLAI